MKPPSRIDIQVTCNEEINLGDIIVRMTVHSGTKNPFYIYFPKTSNEGRTFITTSEFTDQFVSHYEIGLMDYNGSIDSASQVVDLDLDYRWKLSPSLEIARKRHLLGYEALIWHTSENMIAYFLSCQNDNFVAERQSIEIGENKVVNFEIRKKPS